MSPQAQKIIDDLKAHMESAFETLVNLVQEEAVNEMVGKLAPTRAKVHLIKEHVVVPLTKNEIADSLAKLGVKPRRVNPLANLRATQAATQVYAPVAQSETGALPDPFNPVFSGSNPEENDPHFGQLGSDSYDEGTIGATVTTITGGDDDDEIPF